MSVNVKRSCLKPHTCWKGCLLLQGNSSDNRLLCRRCGRPRLVPLPFLPHSWPRPNPGTICSAWLVDWVRSISIQSCPRQMTTSPLWRFTLHSMASNDVKWPFRKQQQPNLTGNTWEGVPIICRHLIIHHVVLMLVQWFPLLKRILSTMLYAWLKRKVYHLLSVVNLGLCVFLLNFPTNERCTASLQNYTTHCCWLKLAWLHSPFEWPPQLVDAMACCDNCLQWCLKKYPSRCFHFLLGSVRMPPEECFLGSLEIILPAEIRFPCQWELYRLRIPTPQAFCLLN